MAAGVHFHGALSLGIRPLLFTLRLHLQIEADPKEQHFERLCPPPNHHRGAHRVLQSVAALCDHFPVHLPVYARG